MVEVSEMDKRFIVTVVGGPRFFIMIALFLLFIIVLFFSLFLPSRQPWFNRLYDPNKHICIFNHL